jgi:hypothetical protein
MLEEYFSILIVAGVRRNGEEFMAGKWGDSVRMRKDEGLIYFKPKKLFTAIRLRRGAPEEREMRRYVTNNTREHKQGPGIRGWFRQTHSIEFSKFDEGTLQRWFDPDWVEEEDGE